MYDEFGRKIEVGDFVIHKVTRYQSLRTTYGVVRQVPCTRTTLEIAMVYSIIENEREIRESDIHITKIHSPYNCIICNELYHGNGIIAKNLERICLLSNIKPNLIINKDYSSNQNIIEEVKTNSSDLSTIDIDGD